MFVPALTLILALASTTVIAVPMANNVYKRSAASLDPSSTESHFISPNLSMKAFPQWCSPSPSSKEDGIKTATDYISTRLNLGENDFKVVNSYTDPFEQHLAKRDLAVSEPKVTLSFEDVSSTASTQLKIPVYSEFAYTLEYVAQSDGKVVYTYTFQLRDNPLTRWVQVWCDTTTGEVVQAINFSNKVSYIVIGLPHRDPTDGLSWLVGPSTKKPTRRTWTDGKATEGNNAIALSPSGKTTRSIRKSVFYTKFNSQEDPGSAANIAAAAVNLFYITNTMHDISYQYGFTESAGNFQKNNFGLGGKGNDAVTINVLNPSDTNNAGFITPPDGQPGVMNMYRYTRSTPNRNPGLDNGAVIHEYAHGISHRLTGGPATSWCLNKGEARGMGEGWSDIISMIVLAKSSDTATTGIAISAYSTNHPEGIRTYPYTTSMWYNPLKYSDLHTLGDSHDIGEVWATMLWEVYWNLVTKHGFSTNLYDAKQSAGNIVALKIIMGGLTLQPCNPTFLGARDAILSADDSHYQGAHKCEIYKGFAKRGLGLGATDTRTDDFRFHLNVGSDSAPVSYDGISTSY
ncbi:hypothetical protein BASA83_010698 [Batrachochytrium salamandrivorans]|nr:hypothetical protein BASA83_010698 [Batrachochytrium salamandrivorans]